MHIAESFISCVDFYGLFAIFQVNNHNVVYIDSFTSFWLLLMYLFSC